MLPKKRAFTLTEMLVIVVVLGVLAAISFPKFSKMLETRKTTEAEGVMRAVRLEQERRCSLDKGYLTDFGKLPDLVAGAPANGNHYDSAHYRYTLANTGGMNASSSGSLRYELQMPSYADGRVCCEGADCTKLNKDYPTCTELQNRPDYVEAFADCVGEGIGGETPDPGTCTTPNPGVEMYNCCDEEGLRGKKTREYYCDPNEGEWKPGPWQGKCEPNPDSVSYTESRSCGGGNEGLKTRMVTKVHSCPNKVEMIYGEWDESACTRPTQWRWVVGSGILTAWHWEGWSDPNQEFCDWGDAWTHTQGAVLFHPSWLCAHCNQLPECNEQNRGLHRYWHCYKTWGIWKRYCHVAYCTQVAVNPPPLPGQEMWKRSLPGDANPAQPGTIGYTLIVSDPNNPLGLDPARPDRCE